MTQKIMMKNRLIDADKLVKRLKATCDIVCQYSTVQRDTMCVSCGIGSVLEILENFPTAEVKRGRWIETTKAVMSNGEFLYTELRTICSLCGKEPLYSYWHNEMQSPYCPWCGAKMDEVDKNGDEITE